jgi:hypothetical protein
VTTENVSRLVLGPLTPAARVDVRLDGIDLPKLDLGSAVRFVREGRKWTAGAEPAGAGHKRPGLSGPFGDIFIGPTVVVHGQAGSEAERHFNETAATNAVRFFNRFNGGVHRGGILGENAVPIPVIADARFLELASGAPALTTPQGIVVDRALLDRANLLFVGNPRSNAALQRLASSLPVVFGDRRLQLGGRTFTGEHLACTAVFPHPDNRRYVGIIGGSEPDALCWGSHLNLQLLPDYIVFDRARVAGWGFFDSMGR